MQPFYNLLIIKIVSLRLSGRIKELWRVVVLVVPQRYKRRAWTEFSFLKQQQSLVICRQLWFVPNHFLHQLSIFGMPLPHPIPPDPSTPLPEASAQALLPPPVWPFFPLLLQCNPRSRTFSLTWFQIPAFLKCCFSSKGANTCTHAFACVVMRFPKLPTVDCGHICLCTQVLVWFPLSDVPTRFLFHFVLEEFSVWGLFYQKVCKSSSNIYK